MAAIERIKSLYSIPDTPDFIPLALGQRLVAIGDIHGDINLLHACLQAGGLVDHEYNWSGGNSICVQVGDVLDRGQAELECLQLLCKLARQAPASGGSVVILWGNHEVENACGNYSHTCTRDTGFGKEFGSAIQEKIKGDWHAPYSVNDSIKHDARWAALEPGGILSSVLLAKLKVAVRVGGSVLVHAGLTGTQIRTCGSMEDMNRLAREWITSTKVPPQASSDERAMAISEMTPQFLQSFPAIQSPLWMRNYSAPADKPPNLEGSMDASEEIDVVLEMLDADRMIVGHTVQFMINSVLDQKVWRIDIGTGVPFSFPDRSTVHCAEVLEVVCGGSNQETVKVLSHVLS